YIPGDIRKMLELIKPDYAVITGLNSAHIENFGSIEAIKNELFTVEEYLNSGNIYINLDDINLANIDNCPYYSIRGTGKVITSGTVLNIQETRFDIQIGDAKYQVATSLLGQHNIGPISLGIELGLELGLDVGRLMDSVQNIKQVKHRMSTSRLSSGATLIDDSYNGNIDGIRAGSRLLKKFKQDYRIIYITSGLVEQGSNSQVVHQELGRIIAEVSDQIFLINNSVTEYILEGISDIGFQGKLTRIDYPVNFYKGLAQRTTQYDIIIIQNDWPDLYNWEVK
ncbi:hypothetical protein KC853_01485, partial [Candidatus Saccharibacteria bacterium]|nr:hypothetical protein [Candidatus Saccharibacteria bacterium]